MDSITANYHRNPAYRRFLLTVDVSSDIFNDVEDMNMVAYFDYKIHQGSKKTQGDWYRLWYQTMLYCDDSIDDPRHGAEDSWRDLSKKWTDPCRNHQSKPVPRTYESRAFTPFNYYVNPRNVPALSNLPKCNKFGTFIGDETLPHCCFCNEAGYFREQMARGGKLPDAKSTFPQNPHSGDDHICFLDCHSIHGALPG